MTSQARARQGFLETATIDPSSPGTTDPLLKPAVLARTFPDGTLVAERYRVVRFIAEGSRGEVYEAEDLSLHERVALKTIRPEFASTPEAIKRFKRELRLARRVTHPNVCRVFDLGEHRGEPDAQGSARAVAFLTMELLPGQTLREYIAQHGRIPLAQLLPLAAQMAAALDAAHAAQVIHRDFKSSNVVLLPSPSSPIPRVVVTDFGLALAMIRSSEDSSDLKSNSFAGTPSYMSPEQVEGLELSTASDLYSFGVVLYEMLTGRLPFTAATPMATALQRLHVPPASPRTWVPDLPPQWEAVLLRCLAKAPRDRFATASDIIASLGGLEREPPSVPEEVQPPASFAPVRRGVAVFTPRSLNARPETAWLGTALAEVLSAELAASGQVRLLSGEEVARIRKELFLPEQEGFARDTLNRIRTHSRVDLVLTGTYLAIGQPGASTLRLDLRLQDAATGEALVHLTETGREQELLALVARAGGTLRMHLGLAPPTSEQARRARSAMPATPEAARLYAEGLAALRNHDSALAVEKLEQAVSREPHFALAHSALSAACKELFLAERAKEAARWAFELSEGLPREERLLIQARHHEAQADWGLAINAYQALVNHSPDSVDYGIALVSAQVAAGQPRAARATIAALRQLPPPLSEDARVDLAESSAASSVADFEASRVHAEAAEELARRSGQWLIVATALIAKAFAVRNLGNPAGAIALMRESEQLFLQGGDRGGAIRAMSARSIALTDLTRLREARAVSEDVLRMVQGYRGSLIEGEVLGNAGWLVAHLGNVTEALKLTSDAVTLFQRLEMPTELAHFTVQLAMVRRYQGMLDEAQRLLEEARHSAQELGDIYTEAWAQQELGELFMDRGDVAQARASLEQALKLRLARGLQAFMVQTGLSLAKLALKEGLSERAISLVEQARAFYVEQQNRDRQGLADALMVRALLVRGETARARKALASARALARATEDVFILAEIVLTEAWAATRVGTPAEKGEAAQQLQELIARAQEGGLKGLELQARLSSAELAQARGAEESRAECQAVEQEAARLGYLAIGQRARAVVKR